MAFASSHLNRVERVSCQDEERLIVFSAEQDVDGALRNFDDAYLPAFRIVDKDLALGDVDVAGCVTDGALAALLGKELQVGKHTGRIDLG
jgi:hypothetical protein